MIHAISYDNQFNSADYLTHYTYKAFWYNVYHVTESFGSDSLGIVEQLQTRT